VSDPPRPARTALVLAALFVLDLFVAGQGFASLAVAAVGLVLSVIGALWSALRGHSGVARRRLGRAALYLALGVATVGALRLHAATAERRAAEIIQACRSHAARHGVLPRTLDELVPRFLDRIPRARYTVAWGTFTYVSSSRAHTLLYVAVPPHGRRLYHFEADRWSTLD
jgi:hypothetical protein